MVLVYKVTPTRLVPTLPAILLGHAVGISLLIANLLVVDHSEHSTDTVVAALGVSDHFIGHTYLADQL